MELSLNLIIAIIIDKRERCEHCLGHVEVIDKVYFDKNMNFICNFSDYTDERAPDSCCYECSDLVDFETTYDCFLDAEKKLLYSNNLYSGDISKIIWKSEERKCIICCHEIYVHVLYNHPDENNQEIHKYNSVFIDRIRNSIVCIDCLNGYSDIKPAKIQ